MPLDDWDTPLTRLILLIMACILFISYWGSKLYVKCYKEITEHNMKLEEAYNVNNLMKQTYELSKKYEINIITDADLKNRQKTYESEELHKRQDSILKTETEISKQICPVGTYVYLEEWMEPARVKSLYGYQATTYEGINFITTDFDSWHMLSWREYCVLKDMRENKKNDE